MHDTELAAAVASRICHDLVSPVGAIVNGVDLMREIDGSDRTEAVGMIGQSAGRASALLQFYRIAFGAAGGEGQPVGRAALRELASVLAQPPRIVLEWQGGPASMPRPQARLVALLVLCARSVTGMRGTIRVRSPGTGTFPLALSVESDAFAATLDMLDLLAGEPPAGPVSPRAVEFVLARGAAAALGIRLAAARRDGAVTIEAGANATAA